MIRRIHVAQLRPGEIELADAQAHHVRDVLRLRQEDVLELFDHEGSIAQGRIVTCSEQTVRVQVAEIQHVGATGLELTIASAIPKGARADWMIEKLSELGVSRFIPLLTNRSIVRLEGANKIQRWVRLATEAARQSRRQGTMKIENLCDLQSIVVEYAKEEITARYLSTAEDAQPLGHGEISTRQMLLVGPEGGWTPDELALFSRAGIPGARLTETVLRTETAAVAAAAVVMCAQASTRPEM